MQDSISLRQKLFLSGIGQIYEDQRDGSGAMATLPSPPTFVDGGKMQADVSGENGNQSSTTTDANNNDSRLHYEKCEEAAVAAEVQHKADRKRSADLKAHSLQTGET